MTYALPLILCLLSAQPVPALPVPPAPPEVSTVTDADSELTHLVLFLLLDDKDMSRGVDGAIIRRATQPPYDASRVDGVPIRILRVQGFDRRAPAWRIGYAGYWTPIVEWCPCCPLYDELAYRVALHREMTLPLVRVVRSGTFGSRTVTRDRQWPTPPTRRIIVRDFIAWRVWRLH